MKNIICRSLLYTTLALAICGLCLRRAEADNQPVSKSQGSSVAFSVKKTDTVRNVLFRLAKAALRQTGEIVTVEVASPMASTPVLPLQETSGTVALWVRLLKMQVPSLSWSSSGRVIHVLVTAPKPYDPFSTKIQTNHTAAMTVDQWAEWIADNLPIQRVRVDDTGYGDQIKFMSTGLQGQTVRLNVRKGMTIRQFLTALAAGCGGTWVADIQNPANQPKRSSNPNVGLIAIRNYTYLFRANDPFLAEQQP